MTPSITGRVTPYFSSSASRTSFNGRMTPASGRITPSTSTGRITPAVTLANSIVAFEASPSQCLRQRLLQFQTMSPRDHEPQSMRL
ncbi:hypothetical protein BDQ17DRAFT_1352651 [Cyathus striatus]|nr:hypothetical protein BDQ17DRAFT_1352651 [Cyathus striatus]